VLIALALAVIGLALVFRFARSPAPRHSVRRRLRAGAEYIMRQL